MEEYILNRRQSREAALVFFYQYLINEQQVRKDKKFFNLAKFIDLSIGDITIYLKNKFKTNRNITLVNDELFVLLVKEMNNIDKYKKIIDNQLSVSWKFDRLSFVEQAILILSYIQLKAGLDERVVINEAIELAKEYCDENSYKFINGVLDGLKSKN